MHRRHRRRLPALAGITLSTILVLATAAAAHLDPEPARVPKGTPATVAFTVEHGCDGSPTVELTFRIPRSVRRSTVAPEPKDGWDASVRGRTVVFSGGPLDAGTADSFSITFTAPNRKTLLTWKIVQECEEGSIRWIDTAHDAEYPPPVVGVGQDPPSHERRRRRRGIERHSRSRRRAPLEASSRLVAHHREVGGAATVLSFGEALEGAECRGAHARLARQRVGHLLRHEVFGEHGGRPRAIHEVGEIGDAFGTGLGFRIDAGDALLAEAVLPREPSERVGGR